MLETKTILFVCPHNAAKSVFAVAELDRLARERGLPLRADSAGTEPDERPAPAVVAALQRVGINVASHQPRHLTRLDVITAHRVVTFGCDLGELAPPGTPIARWDDVLPVRTWKWHGTPSGAMYERSSLIWSASRIRE